MIPYDQDYICFDGETEGLNLYYSRPWQWSFLVCKGQKVLEKHDYYINQPNLDLSPKLKKMCGFDQKRYDSEAISELEAASIFQKYIDDPKFKVIGQNILNYDIFIWNSMMLRQFGEVNHEYLERCLDTRAFFIARQHELEPRGGVDLLNWQLRILNDKEYKFTKSNSKLILKTLGIDFDEGMLHNSLYDVLKTHEIWIQLKSKFNL